MSEIKWDADGTRLYEGGVSHTVLYLDDGRAVPWSGVTTISEKVEGETSTPLYRDGAKYMDVKDNGDYAATLTVFTYPDEFSEYDGLTSLGGGLYAKNQQPKRFDLCYRTETGDGATGLGTGYKLHIVYNIAATQSPVTFATQGDKADPVDFQWTLGATPEYAPGFRATAHAVIDSRRISKYLLEDLEDMLYGTATTAARLPRLAELSAFAQDWALITLVDYGDGTWSATGPSEYISMVDAETFRITGIDGFYVTTDEYEIHTTHAH
jgi:hypothetical protein